MRDERGAAYNGHVLSEVEQDGSTATTSRLVIQPMGLRRQASSPVALRKSWHSFMVGGELRGLCPRGIRWGRRSEMSRAGWVRGKAGGWSRERCCSSLEEICAQVTWKAWDVVVSDAHGSWDVHLPMKSTLMGPLFQACWPRHRRWRD